MTRLPPALLLTLSALALALTVPEELAFQRRSFGATVETYAALGAADRLLPRSSALLLVTRGTDVRHAEYRAFHRALYDLAPRPVYWMNPAAKDGTWESRWWIAAAIEEAVIHRIAAETGADYLLHWHTAVPAPAHALRLADGVWLVPTRAQAADPPAPRGRPGMARIVSGAIVAAALPVLAGWLIATSALRTGRNAPVDAYALAAPLGAGVVAVAMCVLSIAGLTLRQTIAAITAATVLLAGIRCVRLLRTRGDPPPTVEAADAPRPVAWLMALTVLFAFLVSASALGKPLGGWDAWVTWGMKARLIVEHDGVTPALVNDASRSVTLPSYPLLVPLLQAWTYAWAGVDDDRLAGVPTVLFFTSVPLLLWALLRRGGASPAAAAVAACAGTLIPSVWRLATGVIPEGPLAVYALAAAGYLALSFTRLDPGLRVVAALAAALLAWTKTEGMVLALAIAVAPLCPAGRRRRLRGCLFAAASALVLVAPWELFLWWHGSAHPDIYAFESAAATLAAAVERLPFVGWRILNGMLETATAWVWPVAAAVLIIRRPRRLQPHDMLLVAAVLHLTAIAGSYVFSNYSPYQRHVVSSIDRVLSQVTLLIVLWVGWSTPSRAARHPTSS